MEVLGFINYIAYKLWQKLFGNIYFANDVLSLSSILIV